MNDTLQKIAEAFTGFSIYDAIDIAILAVGLFLVFRLIKRRNAKALYLYLAISVAAYFAVLVFREYAPLAYQILSVGVLPLLIVLIVTVFAPEIKRAVLKLSRGRKSAENFSTQYDVSDEVLRNTITEIIRSVQNMSKKNTGALIVISPQHIQSQILESGTTLNAIVSAPLIESIFNTKAPMHDGAVVIRANRILAAGCFLTLTQNANLPQDLGTRHRAALGVTETNDVLAIIVSEQTGIISICRNGVISRYYDSNMLNEVLEQTYGLSAGVRKKKRKLL